MPLKGGDESFHWHRIIYAPLEISFAAETFRQHRSFDATSFDEQQVTFEG